MGASRRRWSIFLPDLALTLDGDGPLYEQIRRAIALKITRRQWLPGDRIPFESELCSALSISRMTVRGLFTMIDSIRKNAPRIVRQIPRMASFELMAGF